MGRTTNRWDAPELCSMARTLEAIGDRWTFLILREATAGTKRFTDFRRALGVAPDVLTARLSRLVEAGVMSRASYQEEGRRARDEYVLTEAGRELDLILAALQQWGDAHLPSDVATITFRGDDGERVGVSFVDARGCAIPRDAVWAGRPPVGMTAPG